MEVTLEMVEKNKGIYNDNIKKILNQRTDLMNQVSKLRRKREKITDEIDIAKLNFEESKLVQQINDLTYIYKRNRLTLEQLELQENVLHSKIDREVYSKGMVANRKAKTDLSNEQELMYCENEVSKCQKALELYTKVGDNENVVNWKKLLEEAKKSLEFAKQEIDKEQKTTVEKNNQQQSEAHNPNKYSEIITPDNLQKEDHLDGYTFEEKDGLFTEEFNQVLKDDFGKEIGNRTVIEALNVESGRRVIETVGNIKNDDGEYSIKEVSEGVGENYSVFKEIKGYNKLTGNNEQFNYSKDEMGNEFAYSMINGKKDLRVSRTNRGTTIEKYDGNGNIQDIFEYDKDGKAIDGFQGIDEIQEDYVEKLFYRIARNIPEYYAEGVDKNIKSKENENILESAVEATEETTRISTINKQAQNIKNMQKEKTQQQNKENNGLDR